MKNAIKICAKCSDMFSAQLFQNGKQVGSYNGYVPDFMPGCHFGDYVELTIDIENGKILNWHKPTAIDLEIFKKA